MIVADDTTENLTNMAMGERSFTARIDGPRDEVMKVLKAIPGVEKVTAEMEREPGIYDYEIEASEDSDIRRDLFRRIADRNWYLLGMKSNAMTLEDIFLKITMGDDVKISKAKGSDDETMKRELMEKVSGAVAAADMLGKGRKAEETAEPEEEDEGGEE